MSSNHWCRTLGIETPKLEAVVGHREANTFALLLVALLERGEPMTLPEVAARFEEAGVVDRERALQSLKRCQPARPPVYREGEHYHLDPHDQELDLWVFRLGLRPPKFASPVRPAVNATPLPGPDVPLTLTELDEAWNDHTLHTWAKQRIVLAVLDARGGPLEPAEVVSEVSKRTRWHTLDEDARTFERRNSAVKVLEDGRWAMADDALSTLKQTRSAVRERVALARKHAALRPDPALVEKNRVARERRRLEHRTVLAELSRALVVVHPPSRSQAAALVDVGEHEITTYVGDELAALRSRLAAFDLIGAVDVRGVLRALEFDPGERRLAELGPPQKSMKLNQRGRTLKLTPALLVQGSCGISQPFGDPKKLAEYLEKGEHTKLRRRLEADAKSLHALYEYDQLHGAVRLRWGPLDERIPAPWVHRDEELFYDLKKSALAMNVPLEVVVGSAPGWSDPWARAQLAFVEPDDRGWGTLLFDADGYAIDDANVQRARLVVTRH